ncbi:zinc metallopeptidase [Tautonia plasticadhaerens]|uniref:Neutral zinc metallopeptidase n=1 Tax=Tautonia plasticadhaerens TaxID=2527974 RepID=A0A518GZY6_9BACT|nr:zinc metallopeptidase [Tautonia plasticadhaerens]QDV34148.1 Putative neutral zinc metallopeptidase [Tautonia plasticadhaerens]
MFLPFDPIYLLIVGPAMLLALWAQARVKSAYAEASQYRSASGATGAQAAAEVMRSEGLNRVEIEPVQGYLSDHYDPRHKVLRLSPGVYGERSLAALGIAAHEAGHALQDAHGYGPLAIRNLLVPVAGFGSSAAFIVFFVGLLFSWTGLVLAGIVLFSGVVAFQLVNLPVEFDASRRARVHLLSTGLITREEEPMVAKVLNAAAWTYVAATLSSVLTLLYFLFRSGLLGGGNRE